MVVLIDTGGAHVPKATLEVSTASDGKSLKAAASAASPSAPMDVAAAADVKTPSAVLQLSFVPPPVPMTEQISLPVEVVFVVDRSGSMEGAPIEAVRDTLQLMLRSLPVHATFNIL
jgi:hypothetical protein